MDADVLRTMVAKQLGHTTDCDCTHCRDCNTTARETARRVLTDIFNELTGDNPPADFAENLSEQLTCISIRLGLERDDG